MSESVRLYVTDIKGNVLKLVQSYEKEADEAIELSKIKLQNESLEAALECMIVIEKKCRNAADLASTIKVSTHMLEICAQAQNWDKFNEYFDQLCRRRGQLKDVVIHLVKYCCEIVSKLTDSKSRERSLRTIINVTDGKVYVENERAKVSRQMSKIKLEEGNVSEALKLISDLQVETYAEMSKSEKAEIILEQIRLCIVLKEFVLAQMFSRKLHPPDLEGTEFESYLFRLYQMRAAIHFHTDTFIPLCEDFFKMLSLRVVNDQEAVLKQALSFLTLFLILTRHSKEQYEFVKKLTSHKHMDEMGMYYDILCMFDRMELIDIPSFYSKYSEHLLPYLTAPHSFSINQYFQVDNTKDLKKQLMTRLAEHNIRVTAEYFSHITMERLADFVSLSILDTESHLAELVRSNTIYARINGPQKRVSFIPELTHDELLNGWASSLTRIMNSIKVNSNSIHRELLMQKMIPIHSEDKSDQNFVDSLQKS